MKLAYIFPAMYLIGAFTANNQGDELAAVACIGVAIWWGLIVHDA